MHFVRITGNKKKAVCQRTGGRKGYRLMIEIIREESWDSTQEKMGLPKNIKQIGTPDIGERIYVENGTYQYMHSYRSSTEKNAYVLLGRFEEYGGRKCTFIEAAILLEEICFDGALPVWNDETWAYLYRRLKHAYDEMVIVGWAMDIRGQLPNLTAPLEKLHRTYFGGMRQLLFLMDSLEGEENFYTQKNGRLSRREGYYIYYDRSIPERLDTAMEMLRQEKEEQAYRANEKQPSGAAVFFQKKEEVPLEKENEEASFQMDWNTTENEDVYVGRKAKTESRNSLYRNYLKEQAEKKISKPAYSSTLLLTVVALALGVAALYNYEKMNAMEETLAEMNTTQTMFSTEGTNTAGINTDTAGKDTAGTNTGGTDTAGTSVADNNGVKIETVSGNVSKNEEQTEAAKEEDKQAATESDQEDAESDNAEKTDDSQAQNSETSEEGDVKSEDSENQKDNLKTTNTEAANEETDNSTESTAASETAETMTESQQYLSQGYYIVQKGESLVGICKKIYQTTAMMDKLCEVNEIEDPDAIYAGQKLILPN